MEERIYKVYKHTFPDGMIYIGMTKHTIQKRIESGYQHNQRMKDAMSFIDKKFLKSEILEDNLTKDEADAAEIKYIAQFNSTDPNVGYNISKGGICVWKGLKHNEATKNKMRISQKGKHSGINNGNYRKKRTEEEKEKNRISHIRFMHPVYQFDNDGNFIKEYESISEAARKLKTSTRNIRMCLTNKSKTACGYKWKYKEITR